MFDNQSVLQHIHCMNQLYTIVIEKTATGFSAFVPRQLKGSVPFVSPFVSRKEYVDA